MLARKSIFGPRHNGTERTECVGATAPRLVKQDFPMSFIPQAKMLARKSIFEPRHNGTERTECVSATRQGL